MKKRDNYDCKIHIIRSKTNFRIKESESGSSEQFGAISITVTKEIQIQHQ